MESALHLIIKWFTRTPLAVVSLSFLLPEEQEGHIRFGQIVILSQTEEEHSQKVFRRAHGTQSSNNAVVVGVVVVVNSLYSKLVLGFVQEK